MAWVALFCRTPFLRAYQASEVVGSRAIITHAKDDAAKAFYQRFDFARSPIFFSSPVGEFHLYLLMKDVRKVLGA
jgi:hypothetical protein